MKTQKINPDKFFVGECEFCGAEDRYVYKSTNHCLQCTMMLKILKEINFLDIKISRIENMIERINERK